MSKEARVAETIVNRGIGAAIIAITLQDVNGLSKSQIQK